MEKEKNKRSFAERVADALELGEGVLPGHSVLTLYGTGLLKIEGGGKIVLYRPDEIRLKLRRGKKLLSVKGEGLCCSSYNRGSVGIEGSISSVEFSKEE